jgi:hypothetical protein
MPFQLMFQSRPVRLIQFLPAKRLFEQERRMGGILTRCFQASQDRLLLLNASRYFDELSLSPLKIVRYCLPVHAAPRGEFQNIGTPQCSTTQVKRVDNPPKVNEATRQRPSCRLPDLSLAWAYQTLSQRTKRRRPDFLGQPIGA